MSGLQVITAPAVYPVDLASVKNYLRVSAAADDVLISSLMASACAYCENYIGRALILQELRYAVSMEVSAAFLPVSLPRPPLVSVSSVQYKVFGRDYQICDADHYQLDVVGAPGSLLFDLNALDVASGDERVQFLVDYWAGYGEAPGDVPEPIKTAMLQIVAALYENRGDRSTGMPVAALALLDSFRLKSVGGAL